ncbi:MAG: TolC family protein [Sulfurifustis sp.]
MLRLFLPERAACAGLLLLAAAGAVFIAAPAAAALSFADAVASAEARAPELTARRNAVESAETARDAADKLPDPKLVLGLDNVPVEGPDRWSLDRDFMTMRRIGFMQEVPNAAKRRARADAAEAMAERERALLTLDRRTVRRDAATAWLARYYLERRLALLDDLDRETQTLIATAQARLRSGQGMPADATMARFEAAMLADRRDDLMRDLARAKAALARFVGDAGNDPLAGDPPVFRIDTDHLRRQLHQHPELAVYEPMAAQAAAETREAQATKRPDWAVELAYQKRGEAFGDMASLQFTFDLPIFTGSRQNLRIAAKLKEQERIASEQEAMRRKHAEELEAWLADYAAVSQKLARTRDTFLPLAQEKADLVLAAYRASKVDITQVLTARRELIEARIKAIELDAEQSAIAAKLVYLYAENDE